MPPSAFPSTPLTLIIRFSASLPDLSLPIPNPTTTNTAHLCTLIRPHLPPALSTSPLRLIHAGALLPPATPLSTSLRLPPPPSHTGTPATPPHPQQCYIHCAIAHDTHLPPADLAAETALAASLSSQPTAAAAASSSPPPPPPPPPHQEDSSHASPPTTTTHSTPQHSTTLPPPPQPPQGFDRLLAAGLTPPEIASLRSQFLALQSHTHTPDSMPTAAQMRVLEERWLDDSASGGGGRGGFGSLGEGRGGGGGGGGEEDDDGSEASGLEDMLWGNVMGFFWAVGAVVWLVREEGVWSKRRQIGVVTGVLVNLAFCVLRAGS